ncbi:MAG: hypothetical protein ACFB0E_21250 [Leptolyngbyaceae cyanobacterium]
MNIDSSQKLEYLYKEYSRLSEKSDELIKDSLNDLRLFGAVSVVIIIWNPIYEAILATNPQFDSALILLLGFFGLLAIMGIVAYLILLKQAYGWYFVHNLQAYELEIKKLLEESENSRIYNFNLGKEESRFIVAVYKTSFKSLALACVAAVNLIPFLILWHSKILYAVIYLTTALFFSVYFFQIFRKIMKQYSDRSYL